MSEMSYDDVNEWLVRVMSLVFGRSELNLLMESVYVFSTLIYRLHFQYPLVVQVLKKNIKFLVVSVHIHVFKNNM